MHLDLSRAALQGHARYELCVSDYVNLAGYRRIL